MSKQTMIWIDALLAGTISESDFVRLQGEMKSDSKALAHYCRQAEIHGRLEWEFSDPQRQYCPVSVPQCAKREVIPGTSRDSAVWMVAAAGIILMLGLLVWLLGEPVTGTQAGAETPPVDVVEEGPLVVGGSVARFTKSQGAQWRDEALAEGAWLAPGSLHLLSGSAELSFDSGARIILQGPAELELVSAHHARLLFGMGTIHIPSQASGFQLETPSSKFSDQDSSFSLAVDANGVTEIHVLDGLVEATPRANHQLARVLSGNEALRLTDSKILGRNKIRHAVGEFDRELPDSVNFQPGRFLHWSFDGVNSSVVPEIGRHGGKAFPARILARPGTSTYASAEFIGGKFGKAIQLNGRGAFLSSRFPGIAGSAARTVAFWVRIPPDVLSEQRYSMIAWGSPGTNGGKWQIGWHDDRLMVGGVDGAIRTEFGGGYVVGSTDLRDGRWHHIVTVFLGGASGDVSTRIRHYIDGRLDPVSAFQRGAINTRLLSARAIPTYIGRRLENDLPEFGFKGGIDELYVFPAALTPSQIENLYLTNTPPTRVLLPGGE